MKSTYPAEVAAQIAARQADVARLGAWGAVQLWHSLGQQVWVAEAEPDVWRRLWPAPEDRA